MAARTAERTDFLASVLSTAVEGGISYWASAKPGTYKWGSENGPHTFGDAHYASITIREDDDGQTGPWRHVSEATIAQGIARVKRPDFRINTQLLGDILTGDRNNDAGEIDADGADVIVQAALFGKIVYG
jgi:hypothetical protein